MACSMSAFMSPDSCDWVSKGYVAQSARFRNAFTEQKKETGETIPITVLRKEDFSSWFKKQTEPVQEFLKFSGMGKFKSGKHVSIPSEGSSGKLRVVLCLPDRSLHLSLSPLVAYGGRAGKGPTSFRLENAEGEPDVPHKEQLLLSWALGTYSFSRFKGGYEKKGKEAEDEGEEEGAAKGVLCVPPGTDTEAVCSMASAIFLIRDLINTPCEFMGPQHIEKVVRELAGLFPEASVQSVVGDELLEKGYGQIHSVGRAAAPERAPRLVDLRWSPGGKGKERLPRLTLVGKGVAFDTGGLSMKSNEGMLLMKKDMGGAAHVLGLAKMIMTAGLPVNLRVLVPTVENNVAGNAYRPSDVITAKNGKTTEVGNTDAEGRLILADALVEAELENPDLLIDFATLTGAARTALGPELPAFFCNDDETADACLQSCREAHDDVWRLPLWPSYRDGLKSDVADMKNVAGKAGGGAIVAALYLQNFLADRGASTGASWDKDGGYRRTQGETPWMHFDLMAWNPDGKPGKQKGGEAQALRGLFKMLQKKFTQ
uniref:Cytosol aminopeptidase domain-containing protein n=1 Tax=Chromera velia CCMP2878 TaxID=1169474 RepID=A0A0G4I6J9_9ALVE|eukprot:Cvel_11415.t1-p1 / transcript=Cvel_11415.t1 / gene=Cvel_11415 / organism=Chromera_velia_CCMP2878 / gene_product=Probable cytosol aminopeptidase, putative / transcript_product=Probable cytosol aminopeptidase, putative / location=Cvel_scaffold717:30120-36539(+) / protein_length=541 / sequence_SO=supercontig / SO=protein_coding / is_pseudo=false